MYSYSNLFGSLHGKKPKYHKCGVTTPTEHCLLPFCHGATNATRRRGRQVKTLLGCRVGAAGTAVVLVACVLTAVAALVCHYHPGTSSLVTIRTAPLPCLDSFEWLSVAQARLALQDMYQVVPPSMHKQTNGGNSKLYQQVLHTLQSAAARQEAKVVTLQFVWDKEHDQQSHGKEQTQPSLQRQLSPAELLTTLPQGKSHLEDTITTSTIDATHFFPIVVKQSMPAMPDEKEVKFEQCEVGSVQVCPERDDSPNDSTVENSGTTTATMPEWPTDEPVATPWFLKQDSLLPQQLQRQESVWMPCGTALWERVHESSLDPLHRDVGNVRNYHWHLEKYHPYALKAPLVWDFVEQSTSHSFKNNNNNNPESLLAHHLMTWPRPLLPLVIRWDSNDNPNTEDSNEQLMASSSSNNATTATNVAPVYLPKTLWEKLGYVVVPAMQGEASSSNLALRLTLDTVY